MFQSHFELTSGDINVVVAVVLAIIGQKVEKIQRDSLALKQTKQNLPRIVDISHRFCGVYDKYH